MFRSFQPSPVYRASMILFLIGGCAMLYGFSLKITPEATTDPTWIYFMRYGGIVSAVLGLVGILAFSGD